MRLFVAVWPDDAAVAHLEAAVAPVRAACDELRWQPRERWHLTLAFLGELDHASVDDVPPVVAAVTSQHGPLPPASLAGSGTFDRVVWVGLQPHPSPLVPLARQLSHDLRRAGFAMERRPWRPHLTVARARTATDQVARARDAIAGYRGPAWPVTDVSLVRSTTGPRPVYSVLERFPVRGA